MKKKLLLAVFALVLVFVAAACGNNEAEDTASEKMISVVIDIDFPDDSNIADVDEAAIEVPENSTVLDVLNIYADKNNMEVVMDESSESAYVTSVGGIAATKTAGWIYEVNDEAVMEPADAYKIKENDEISWDFETWE